MRITPKSFGDLAEIHPFHDGNGRLARIMMNAELFARKQTTIIIPTVYREDYLLALRALSRRERAGPLVAMLSSAQEFSCQDFSGYAESLRNLEARNWFREPGDAKLILE
ncbi:MAG: Fic family protein [Bdellovibrionales bacterium]|nr:Fic family protein [Bdellovibrionales bacterium]